MTRAGRTCAAALALVIAWFPSALERCRIACTASTSATAPLPVQHSCHHPMPGTDAGVTASAASHPCGHNDDERASATIGVFAGKIRVVVPVAAAVPALHVPDGALVTVRAAQPVGDVALAWAPIPLNLPLRL